MRPRQPPLPLALALAGLLAALAAAAAPVEPPAPETFAESIDVRVVNVEVFVADRSGHPVTGLTRDDFELFEDGRPVPITNFYAQADSRPAAETPAAATAATRPETPAPGPPIAPAIVPEAQRLDLGIFIDNLEITPSARNRVLRSIKDFVASHVTAGDRVLLASFDGSLRLRQAPTRDPAALVAAIDQLARTSPRGAHASQELRNLLELIGRVPPPDGLTSPFYAEPSSGGGSDKFERDTLPGILQTYMQERYDENRASLAALEGFVGSVAGLPGRKAVLFVSGDLGLRPGEVVLRAYADKFGEAQAKDIPHATEVEIQPLLTRIVEHANANRVTLYGIGAPENFNSLAIQVGGGASLGNLRFVENDNLAGAMRTVADFTGGFAGIDLSDPGVLLDRLRGDLETFYSLGFSPARAADGKDHKIAVKVKRKGLEARVRDRYRDATDDERLTTAARSALALGVAENPLGVELRVERDEPGKGGNRVVSILVSVPVAKLVLVPRDAFEDGRVTLYVGARDDAGNLSPIHRVEVSLHIPRARLAAGAAAAGYVVKLALSPAEQTVAVTLRDELGRAESTATAPYRPAAAVSAAKR
jgi:VWFA-related protein